MEIQINKSVIREAAIRALTDENKSNREAEFVISTEAVDSFGTVFKMAGWDLKRYNNNPIVCYQHKANSDNPDMILGTSTVRFEDNKMIAVVRFEEAAINPLAEKVWQKVQAGTLRMASIGAIPKTGHWGDETKGEDREVLYFDESELMEWSIVSMGSNPEAMKREAATMEEIEKVILKNKPVEIEVIPETRNRAIRAAQLINNQNKYKK
jgi:HK97 family phage prohead protease